MEPAASEPAESTPESIRVRRRKFSEVEPPDVLRLETANPKRHVTEVFYQRVKDDRVEIAPLRAPSKNGLMPNEKDAPVSTEEDKAKQEQIPRPAEERRVFRISRPQHVRDASSKRKHLSQRGIVATFVEDNARMRSIANAYQAKRRDAMAKRSSAAGNGDRSAPVSHPLKRPGAGSRIDKNIPAGVHLTRELTPGSLQHGSLQQAKREQAGANALAEMMHELVLEDLAKIPKPVLTHRPNRNVKRYHERHPEEAAARKPPVLDEDVDKDEDIEYVYDTYTRSAEPAQSITGQAGNGKVGFLVIPEEDEAVWQTYLDESISDRDRSSEEEDENAENWHGADYPEGEMASDDERNEGAYRYRNNDSDYEQTRAASSDDDDEEAEEEEDKKEDEDEDENEDEDD